MKTDQHLVTDGWEDYELLDSGENMKLERFGEIIVARPETEALWKKQRPELWNDAHAEFEFKEGKGAWKIKKSVPESWPVKAWALTLNARLMGFKHIGIFPEQASNWVWVRERAEKLHNPKVLNLFAYTGGATLAAAVGGAFVTHVDSSKQSLNYGHENAHLSEISEDKIRWIPDDVLAFARRELRRGAHYEGIILDPPAFGRGGKDEVWHIEEDLPKLLENLKELLSEAPGSFFLLNGYAAGYASLSFLQAIQGVFGNVSGESGELRIKESGTERMIPAGIYVRFTR